MAGTALAASQVVETQSKKGLKMRRLSSEINIDLVDLHRKEDCENYEDCLSQACRLKWKSFSCHECEGYEAGKIKEVYLTVEDKNVYDEVGVNISNEWRKKSTKILASMGAKLLVDYSRQR